jgi:hypothetical protein
VHQIVIVRIGMIDEQNDEAVPTKICNTSAATRKKIPRGGSQERIHGEPGAIVADLGGKRYGPYR